MIRVTEDYVFLSLTEKQATELNAVYVRSLNLYKVPKNLHSLRELWKKGIRHNVLLEEGKRLKKVYEKLVEKKEQIPSVLDDGRFRPYQQADINFLYDIPHVAIFNQQRTGKTPTALGLINKHNFRKGIIVCPASLLYNWEKEVKTWTSLKTIVVKGTRSQRLKTYQNWGDDVLIISYDTLKRDIDSKELNQVMDFMLLDEAHYICNHKSKRALACYKIGDLAKKRIALTGTPAKDKGVEIYGILKFLYPNKFPSYWHFAERYFNVYNNFFGAREIGKIKRKEELQEILIVFSVQRKRTEVMKWLPPKTSETVLLEMPKQQREVYNQMLKDFMVQQGDEVKADAPSVLAQLTRLRQICLSPSMLGIEAPSIKEEWLDDFVNHLDGQAVIFSSFSSHLKTLAKKYKAPIIIGETDTKERQKIVDGFQKGKHKILFANIIAAGTGLTLDKADTVVFLDRHFNPIANEQAEDRIVPTSEKSNQSYHVIDLVCRDSVDEKIHQLLSKKKDIIKVINHYKNLKEFLGRK